MPTMGKSLHYLDVGSGFPLLLGHSYLFDLNMWAAVRSAGETLSPDRAGSLGPRRLTGAAGRA